MPPPIPTIPDNRPITAPIMGGRKTGLEAWTAESITSVFCVIRRKPESNKANPNRPIKKVSDTINWPPNQAAGIDVTRNGNMRFGFKCLDV